MTNEDGYRWEQEPERRGFQLGDLVRLAGVVLLAAAVLQQLRRPAGERDWQGRVLGLVPYDFRPPSIGRFASRWFNPNDHRLFTEHAFGIGWSVNFAQALKLVTGLVSKAR